MKSLVGARAHDDDAWPAYLRLRARFTPWERLADAELEAVEATIAPVVHADLKARWLVESLARIRALRGELSLDFLTELSVDEAMAWLQALPGVGGRIAAAVLNFSTLRRPVMMVESHVWRVARRIGLAGETTDPDGVRTAIMATAPASWTADDFHQLHWLLKRLGQTLCLDARTRCGACAVASLCRAKRERPALKSAEVVALAPRGYGNKQ